MSKAPIKVVTNKLEKEPLEIIVSNYWPTKILKSIKVTVPGKDTWHNDVTLDNKAGKYLYEQLKVIFDKEHKDETDS